MKKFILLSFLVHVATLSAQYGVQWEYNSPVGQDIKMNSITQTQNGEFLLSGYIDTVDSNGAITQKTYVKLDEHGGFIWEKNRNKAGSVGSSSGLAIISASSGGFASVGSVDGTANSINKNAYLVRSDAQGDTLWTKVYFTLTYGEEATSVVETVDKGFLLGCSRDSFGLGDSQSSLIKVDSLGNIEWINSYNNYHGNGFLGDVIQTADSGFILTGAVQTGDARVVKIDAAGNVVWENTYGGSSQEFAYSITPTQDGNYAILAFTLSDNGDVSNNNGVTDYWLFKIDDNGTLLWEQNFGGAYNETPSDLVQLNNGNFVMVGFSASNDQYVTGNSDFITEFDIWVVVADSAGNVIWEHCYGSPGIRDIALQVEPTLDGEFVVLGQIVGEDVYSVMKFGPLPGLIEGKVVLDANQNCQEDVGEVGLPYYVIEALNLSNGGKIYSTTDTSGAYSLSLDTANYQLTILNNMPYLGYPQCALDTVEVVLNSTDTAANVNFYRSTNILCPFLSVDITSPILRPCMNSNYYVNYCNTGTAIAQNAFIEIELDSRVGVISTSIPFTVSSANIYSFEVGDIDLYDCGSFSLVVEVNCDSTILGEILCVEAHIYPDTFCLPTQNWNGSELKASVACLDSDSVEFNVKNIGNGDMLNPSSMIVIEDVILRVDSFVQLDSGDSIRFVLPIIGLTQRLIVAQSTNHPFKTFSTDAVNACFKSTIIPPILDTTFITYPNDEEPSFIAIDCQPLVGSFDPNDKQVYPVGATSNHYISEVVDLEYKIRFQNTGTDTAFIVRITDTISDLLDLGSIVPGASSHPYVFDISGTGIVTFTFNNILLPDSFVNEPESHGFVQFKVKQQASNQVGNIIYNNADIYFDYNEPVRTNTVFNTIGGIELDTLLYSFAKDTISGIHVLNSMEIKVYPNPANNLMIFDFGEKQDQLNLELFSADGKIVLQTSIQNSAKLQLNRGSLKNGIYFFRISSAQMEFATGSLIFK